MYTYIYIYKYIYTCKYIYVFLYIHIYIHVHVHIHVLIFMYIHVYIISTNDHVYTLEYTYMYTSVYLYICEYVYFDLIVHVYFCCVALHIAVGVAVGVAMCAVVRVAVCVSVFQCFTEHCRVLQSVLQDIMHCVLCRHDHHQDDPTPQQRVAARCSVVPCAAVRCLQPLHHVPCAVAADTRPPASRCLPSLARPYLDDSSMPSLDCKIEAAGAVVCDECKQRCSADLTQHLHPCGPARVMCVCVCVCLCMWVCVCACVSVFACMSV